MARTPTIARESAVARVIPSSASASLQQRGAESEALPVPEYRASLAHPGPAIRGVTHARPRRTQSICAKSCGPAECTPRPSDGLRATGSSIRAETHKSLVACKHLYPHPTVHTSCSPNLLDIQPCIRLMTTNTRAHLNDQQRVGVPGHRHHPLYLARARTSSP
jgi:hypothetical protein